LKPGLNGGGGFTARAWYSVNILTGPHSVWLKRAAVQVDGGDLDKVGIQTKNPDQH